MCFANTSVLVIATEAMLVPQPYDLWNGINIEKKLCPNGFLYSKILLMREYEWF